MPRSGSRALARRGSGRGLVRYGRSSRGHLVRNVLSLARRAGPFVSKAYSAWKNYSGSKKSTGPTLTNPVRGVESGFASGHSAYTSHSKVKRLSKKSFKKKVKFEKKVREAVAGVTKHQQFFQNVILGGDTPADWQNWFEIPVMAGGSYGFPGTSNDAADILYRAKFDEGDFVPMADLVANAQTTSQLMSNQTVTYGALPGSTTYINAGKFYVYGYCLQYELQNNLTVPMVYTLYEVECKKTFSPTVDGVFNGATSMTADNSTGVLNRCDAANAIRRAAVSASGTQVQVNAHTVGVTPFLYSDFGRYFSVVRTHVHVLDPLQVVRLEKVYKFKNAISIGRMNSCVAMEGVTKFLMGRVTGLNIGDGNYASGLTAAIQGAAGYAHSFCVNYKKRFVMKPVITGNQQYGVAAVLT